MAIPSHRSSAMNHSKDVNMLEAKDAKIERLQKLETRFVEVARAFKAVKTKYTKLENIIASNTPFKSLAQNDSLSLLEAYLRVAQSNQNAGEELNHLANQVSAIKKSKADELEAQADIYTALQQKLIMKEEEINTLKRSHQTETMSFKLKIKELSNNESFNLKLKIKELSCNLSEVSQQRDAAHEKLQEYDSNLVSSIDDELFASLQNDTLISDKPIKTNVMSENVKDLWIKIDGLNTEVKELRASQDSLREQNKALKKENENYVDSSFEKEVVVQKTSSMGISFAGFSLTGPGTQALPKPVVSTNEPNSFESLTFKVKIKELNSKLLNVTKERDEAFLKLKIAQEAEKAFLEADAHIDKSFYSDQIKILEGNIEILSLKLEETSNSNSALSGLVHSIRSENDIMQDQRTQLHEQNIELTAMTLDLRQNVSSMFADMSDLLEKTETCKKELETLKDGSSLYAIDQVKQEYREFQAGVQFRVSGLMSKLEQSEIEKAKLENHINEHLNLVKELREPTGLVPVPIIDPQEFEDCKKLIEMLSDDNEELKDIIFKTKQNLTKVETHLASITVQNTEKIKELTAKNVDLEFKILVFESTDPKNLQKRFAALNQVQGNYKEE